jgi:calcium-dependent protein kinase
MISGRPPFDGSSETAILNKVKSGKYHMEGPEFESASEGVKDFIKKLMEVNYNKRLSAKEALAHPWIKEKVKSTFNEKVSKIAMQNLQTFTVSYNHL